MISGFIKSVLKGHNKNNLKDLYKVQRALTLKKMSMEKDLKEVVDAFKANNINFCVLKGAALNQLKIYDSGVRFYRDLDILVDIDHLSFAFKILNSTGFSYLNKLSRNQCKILGNMHHLPAMVNKNGTIIELHHRITLKDKYKICPLTNDILDKKVSIGNYFVPDPAGLVAHCIYHGLSHSKISSGPTFLFDLQTINKKLDFDLSKSRHLLLKLNLEKELDSIIHLFERIENSCSYSEMEIVLDQIGNNIDLKKKESLKHSIFDLEKVMHKISFNSFKRKIESVEYLYQTNRYQPWFFIYFVIELSRSAKNLKFF